MTDTIRELVDSFNLKKEVDWGLLGVIADAFREEGNDVFADYLQACSSEQCLGPPYYSSIHPGNLMSTHSSVLRAAIFVWNNTGTYGKQYYDNGRFVQHFQRYYDKTLGLIVNEELHTADLDILRIKVSEWPEYLHKLLPSKG